MSRSAGQKARAAERAIRRAPIIAAKKEATRERALAKLAPPCTHCSPPRRAVLVTGAVIYPHRPDLSGFKFWRCDCGAYVGCHKPGIKPLGYPADAATRKARGEAHAAFDPLWRRKAERDAIPYGQARADGYAWLGEQLRLAPADCHIGMMNEATAMRVVSLCRDRARGVQHAPRPVSAPSTPAELPLR